MDKKMLQTLFLNFLLTFVACFLAIVFVLSQHKTLLEPARMAPMPAMEMQGPPPAPGMHKPPMPGMPQPPAPPKK